MRIKSVLNETIHAFNKESGRDQVKGAHNLGLNGIESEGNQGFYIAKQQVRNRNKSTTKIYQLKLKKSSRKVQENFQLLCCVVLSLRRTFSVLSCHCEDREDTLPSRLDILCSGHDHLTETMND